MGDVPGTSHAATTRCPTQTQVLSEIGDFHCMIVSAESNTVHKIRISPATRWSGGVIYVRWENSNVKQTIVSNLRIRCCDQNMRSQHAAFQNCLFFYSPPPSTRRWIFAPPLTKSQVDIMHHISKFTTSLELTNFVRIFSAPRITSFHTELVHLVGYRQPEHNGNRHRYSLNEGRRIQPLK